MFYSQIGQDRWVNEQLKGKRDGTFLDVGCSHFKENGNNTFFFESELNWRGIAIDLDCSNEEGWRENRKQSKFVCTDATTLDYGKLLKENNMPQVIDYLSLDLEPPMLTLVALKKILETEYSFNCVTFETDFYREHRTRDESRRLFHENGYIWQCEVNPGLPQDDFYIHKRLLSA